jgi:hypothetical protein
MKTKKMVVPIFAVAFLMTFVVIDAGSSSAEVDQAFIGHYCFKLDAFTDTWHWIVEDIGSAVYRLNGWDHAYPGNALHGSGHREGIMFYATQTMSVPYYSAWCVMIIELHLGTMTGTVDMTWHDYTGLAYVYYDNLTFAAVACPPANADLAGPRTGDR